MGAIAELFPGQEIVKAFWFTGVLKMLQGKIIRRHLLLGCGAVF
jgi:hypothetical protein